MSITKLLDKVSSAGLTLEETEGFRREQAEGLVLPLWSWLTELQVLANENGVEWDKLDDSLALSDQQQIAQAIDSVLGAIDARQDEDFSRALVGMRATTAAGITHAQERLREEGVEAQSIAALFLPIRSQLASWGQRERSQQDLGRVRSALGELGGRGLALDFNEQFAEDLKQANRFRLAAMGFFMLAVTWSIVVWLIPTKATAASIGGRAGVAVSLVIVGGFLVRESVQHRVDANVWRTVQLQLDAIERYTVNLPRDSADALRFVLGLAVFSGPRLYAVAAGRGAKEPGSDGGENAETIAAANVREALAAVREITEIYKMARSG
jgi:hypothetical protein